MKLPAIRLVVPDLALIEAALAGDEQLAAALGHPVAPQWASFPRALEHSRASLVADPGAASWGTRFFVAAEPEPELVGWGGFKGPPSPATVELGYEIAESRRRRGYASAAIAAMLDEAFAAPEVERVIAHTLPEENTSNRLLRAAGFRFDGDATDQGRPAWRFARGREGRGSA